MGPALGQPVETFSTADGTLQIWRPAPTVFVTRIVGVLSEPMAIVMEAATRRQVAEDGRHLAFHDWQEMSSYASAARTRLTSVSVSILKAVDGAHILLGSRVVTFGVQLANVVIRKLTVHTSRTDFERALADAIRRRRDGGPNPT